MEQERPYQPLESRISSSPKPMNRDSAKGGIQVMWRFGRASVEQWIAQQSPEPFTQLPFVRAWRSVLVGGIMVSFYQKTLPRWTPSGHAPSAHCNFRSSHIATMLLGWQLPAIPVMARSDFSGFKPGKARRCRGLFLRLRETRQGGYVSNATLCQVARIHACPLPLEGQPTPGQPVQTLHNVMEPRGMACGGRAHRLQVRNAR